MSVESPLFDLEPELVWRHFDGIRRVPRPSKKEERIVRHVRSWAAEHGFEVREDAAGNLVIAVPASPGRDSAPTVVLQAHLDMVCEKNEGSDHDFDHDPIEVWLDGEWVRARATTLGADNGLGAAAAMAVAVDPEAVHGPLELLFTLDEETGLNGAAALDPSLVRGRLLVNLDTEEDGVVYIGCAGAQGVRSQFTLDREELRGEPTRLEVTGLAGGHSGMDIDQNRGNAIQIAARVLAAARERGIEVGLRRFRGGSKANALPREAFVDLALRAEDRAGLEAVGEAIFAEVRAETGAAEPDLRIRFEHGATPTAESLVGVSAALRDRFVAFLLGAPHGVLAMSREVPGLVETSCNLAVAEWGADAAEVFCSFRSSVNASLEARVRALEALSRLAGAEPSTSRGYPGWQPDPGSDLVRHARAAFAELHGSEPGIKAVHAGLECGILVEKIPGMQAVSIGPDIRGAHSPDERVHVPSVPRFYRWLTALLESLAA